jgi:hypothetical protein
MPDIDPTTNPDVQEALSRRYSDDIIMLLPLRSGAVAVFNAARELCGFSKFHEMTYKEKYHYHFVDWILVKACWHPPAAAPTLTKPPVDLEELDLI